jgi:Rrf2 family iron-sulfur cluster assembly transcriptional regulator
MKLTSKGRYAVMAMADLAKINKDLPTSLSEISLRQGISISFLEQIFFKLKKNNLVQSSRGPTGGYSLTKKPQEIKLSSIIKAVDEKVKTVGCKKESKKGCNGKSVKCITHNLWDDLENHINDFFERNTLGDIILKSTRDKESVLH